MGRFGLWWRTGRVVFGQPQLRRAELAFVAMLTADWALTVAVAVVAFADGGAGAVAIVAVARMLPAALGAPVLAAVSDRGRREHSLAAIAAARALLIGGAAVLLAIDASHAGFYVLVVLASIVMAAFRPVHSALLPLLCSTTTELAAANVVRGVLESAATLMGPLVAGAFLEWGDAASACAAAAVVSAAAAFLLIRIRYEAPSRSIGPRAALLADTVEGVRVAMGHRDLRWIFGLGSAQAFVRGALNVFLVVVAIDLLGIGNPGVAALSGAIGVGGLVGSFVVFLLVGSCHLGRWLCLALVLWGSPIALVAAFPATAPAFVLFAVIGLANALIDVPLFTLPVRLVRDEVLGRAFGAFEGSISLGVALGAAAAPLAIRLVGTTAAMVGLGLLLPALATVAWRPLAALDGRLGARDLDIDLLRAPRCSARCRSRASSSSPRGSCTARWPPAWWHVVRETRATASS